MSTRGEAEVSGAGAAKADGVPEPVEIPIQWEAKHVEHHDA